MHLDFSLLVLTFCEIRVTQTDTRLECHRNVSSLLSRQFPLEPETRHNLPLRCSRLDRESKSVLLFFIVFPEEEKMIKIAFPENADGVSLIMNGTRSLLAFLACLLKKPYRKEETSSISEICAFDFIRYGIL